MFDRGGGGVVRMEGKLWRIVTLVGFPAAALTGLPATLNTTTVTNCDTGLKRRSRLCRECICDGLCASLPSRHVSFERRATNVSWSSHFNIAAVAVRELLKDQDPRYWEEKSPVSLPRTPFIVNSETK